jgi:ParB family chromosome partitioning protein
MSIEKQQPARRLGRGLDALIPSASSASTAASAASDLQRIPIARIRPNPYQPRREFDPEELAELTASLKASGLLQPITVRRRGDAYELVTGERRLRAATGLGWTEIQAIVRDLDDQTMLVVALIENLQRTDLNVIEEARGYRRLIDEFQLTQQQVADAVGKDRTTITNLLRVLSLPDDVQALVASGELSGGHARALLALAPPHSSLELARVAVNEGFSVRELERRVRGLMQSAAPLSAPPTEPERRTKEPGSAAPSDPAARQIEDQLRRYLQTDVYVQPSGEGKGVVRISFYSNDDLDRLLDLILRERRDIY